MKSQKNVSRMLIYSVYASNNKCRNNIDSVVKSTCCANILSCNLLTKICFWALGLSLQDLTIFMAKHGWALSGVAAVAGCLEHGHDLPRA